MSTLHEWLQRASEEPWRYDFYRFLRHIEAVHPELPRLGEALRPAEEPVRLSQPAELSFAPTPLQAVKLDAGRKPRIEQRIFGFTGPNGPLPLHLTELVRERRVQSDDPTLQRFLDLLGHRLTLLFYRAWAQAQPTISLDRRSDQSFALRLGALSGIGAQSLLGRDAVGDAAKLHFTGRLARQTRDADGLLQWCRSEFDAQVRIEQWKGHWMPLGSDERTRLRTRHKNNIAQCLGQGAVLGAMVWDVQHKFRIVIGPLREARYHAFLPGGSDLARLQAMVRQWVGLEFEWDLQLILVKRDVPRLMLGRSGELGRSTWLGRYNNENDADELVIDVERTLTRARARMKQKVH
ncbi:MAG: type VI secretion system baseplate subunit TssG [Paucibacter sp.]|nr:type VI secretion system baseplate subunit TssG [Roseateles sp.]